MESTIFFDGQKVVVEHTKREVGPVLDFLFGDLPKPSDPETEPSVAARFVIEYSDENAIWSLRREQQSLFKGSNINGLANMLMGEVLFHLIKGNSSGMAIHAGLVSGKNGAVLMPAESGSGKSSLTTWLVVNGLHYHTDELVIINPEDHSLKAFTRPLNIKSRGVDAIQSIFDLEPHNADIRSSQMVTMIPHRLVNENYQDVIPPLGHIIYPKYVADSDSEITRLSGAEAGLELMRSNVIARNLPNHGFSQVTRLVRDVPAYRLRYKSYDDLPELLEGII
ncbi:MAG: hypothetical protein AAF402_11185 [Pseudomonadota bacterium]